MPEGSILRIKCDYKCFVSSTPYDEHCDRSKKGTAFLLQINGVPIILTAHHVVSNAVSVIATSPSLPDGEARRLTIIGYNPDLDIAILSGPKEVMKLPPFLPSRSSTLSPKNKVVCVGFANGTLRTHTTSGTISGRNDFPHNRIQTDTAVNPGNSGGPMLDAKTMRVLGVVTSGMDSMQATNFFTPMDEAYLCIRRIIHRYKENNCILGVDRGFTLNAIVRSVNKDACNGKTGGALVVACSTESNLKVGDVITDVVDKKGTLVHLNAHMRVNAPTAWSYDAIDFRSILDTLESLDINAKWKMTVRRDDVVQTGLLANVGPSCIQSREFFPDCEMVPYVTFGGIIVMTLSTSHVWDVSGIGRESMRKPEVEFNSVPVITHITAGSPFDVHDNNTRLEGSIIKKMMDKNNVEHDIKTLNDVFDALMAINPIILTTDTGARVGCSETELQTFEQNQTDATLFRGHHSVRRGTCATTTFKPALFAQLLKAHEARTEKKTEKETEKETVTPPRVSDAEVTSPPVSATIPEEYDVIPTADLEDSGNPSE